MCKRIILFLFICLFLFLLPEKPSAIREGKIWIFLKGRPYLFNRSLHPAQLTYFSRESMERRSARALESWDESDFPPDPAYLASLRKAGAQVLRESYWLNAVSARCDTACLEKIRTFDFVSEIRPVLTFRRPAETIEILPEGLHTRELAGLNYGGSKEQLLQLKVPPLHNRGYAGQGEVVAVFDTGFRKDHIVFQNKVIKAERDFVFNDNNVSNGVSTDSHGTGTWSCVGGEAPGKYYGPAYKASFILAATEDIRSETVVEEDNWVAALEWADRQGATVISSSLGYSDWYSPADFNGTTPITSRVASTAARKGILVVNSAGNSGPAPSTLSAPADAFNILTVGAVDARGNIADFSSRGPTADGRLKPEVVARGVFTYVASSLGTAAFGRSSGTSFSCPLVAGTAAVLLSVRRDWTPLQAREALMKTANRAATPDNTYGYGIPNLVKAVDYLPTASVVIDHQPLKNTSATTSYRIQARIRAQRGLNPEQLFLYWKKDGTETFQKVLLKVVSGQADRYQATIPGQPKGTTIVYYLTARDVKGKITRAPYGAPKNVFRFQIL